MALSFTELKQLVSGEGLKYFEDAQSSRLLVGVAGLHGKFQFVVSLLDDGRFLQLRTVRYLEVPGDHKGAAALLQAIAAINLELRFLKFAWDARDGEVVVYADAWIMDGKITQQQMSRIFSNFIPTIDLQYRRITRAVQDGKDAGPITPQQAVADLLADPHTPPEVLELLKGAGKPAGGGSKGDIDRL
jgi:hypothetical protein